MPKMCLSIYNRAADKGFSLTLMERLVKEIGGDIVSTLTIQYRMHSTIMQWPSHALYEDSLIADDSVARHLLRCIHCVCVCVCLASSTDNTLIHTLVHICTVCKD